jgi:hypothetical protein
MSNEHHWLSPRRNPTVRTCLVGVGILLLLITPVVGVIPGPGGAVVFAAGAALVLRYATWAKRLYVRMERRYPKAGAWADWALRRPSPKRRHALRHQRKACAGAGG